MPGPLDFELPEMLTSLKVDAMYFRAAIEQRDYARAQQQQIETALSSVSELQQRADEISASGDPDEELEGVAIQLEGREYELAAAHAPALASIASVHVLAAASAEAHINQLGKRKLSGKYWDNFEKMAAESKWLFLPKLVGCEGLDAGAKVYQQLSTLFKRRNALIHYKPRREPWTPPGVPHFLETLGLTIEAADESIAAVRDAIMKMSQLLSETAPFWLTNPTSGGFFEIDFESPKVPPP